MIAIDTVLTKQLTALRLISRVKSPLSKQRHTPDDHGDGDDESDHHAEHGTRDLHDPPFNPSP